MNTAINTAAVSTAAEAAIGNICADLEAAGVEGRLIGSIWEEFHAGDAVRLAKAIHWAWGAHPKIAA